MRTIALLTAATCAISLFGCGQPIPESWKSLGLPIDDLKVAHGTTPSDTSLLLFGPVETPPQTLCEGLATILQSQGFKPDPDQLLRVTPRNYNVSFKGPKEQVGLFCHGPEDASVHHVDLSRKPL